MTQKILLSLGYITVIVLSVETLEERTTARYFQI